MDMTSINTRVIISGKVQGVYYRSWTKRNALSLGLDGWVRNRTDGTVEAVFSGDKEKVLQMLQRCYRGPDAANVTNIQTFVSDSTPKKGFLQLKTV